MKRGLTAVEARLFTMSGQAMGTHRAQQRDAQTSVARAIRAGTWYRIVNAAPEAPTDETSIYIYDEIGFWGVSAQDFVRDLLGVTSSRIRLHLNTPGGEIFDGIAIYNALRGHPAEITSIVDGLAASAGSFIAQAGDERLVTPNATMMIHDGQGLCMGGAADMREMADLLDMLSDNIASIYAERGGGETAAWREVMLGTKWYTADAAVEAGLADRVEAPGGEPEPEPDNRTKSSPINQLDKPEQPPVSAPAVPEFDRADAFRSALRGAFAR